MIEVELKFPLSDPPSFEEKLIKYGAEFVETEMQKDHYLQHPCKDFRDSDEALRIRVADSKIFLGYKGPKVSYEMKIRKEVEVEVSSFESILKILKNLGFMDVITIRKLRKIYKYSDFKIAIDIVDGLGSYVEIETLVDSVDKGYKAMKKVKDLSQRLGLDIKNSIIKSYLELYVENHGIQ